MSSESKTQQESDANRMGCCSSNAIHPLNSLQSGVQKDAAPRQPPISNKQADLIQSSWQGVETDLQGHGLTLFERLFTQHPDIRKKFYFALENENDIVTIMADERLAKHAKGVMDTISVAVAMLSDLGSVVPILKQLGASHAKFNLQPEHFQAVGGSLLWTLENALGDEFTDEVRQAWLALYTVVTTTMTAGMEEVAKM